MLTRIQFLRSLAGLTVGAVGASMLVGCRHSLEDDSTESTSELDAGLPPPDATNDGCSSSPIDGATPACQSTNVTIGANHPRAHKLEVPVSDVDAGVAKEYDIRGDSSHPHTILVTAEMFAMLRDHQLITVTSSTVSDHEHDVTISCT